jgi:hypothetical protein
LSHCSGDLRHFTVRDFRTLTTLHFVRAFQGAMRKMQLRKCCKKAGGDKTSGVSYGKCCKKASRPPIRISLVWFVCQQMRNTSRLWHSRPSSAQLRYSCIPAARMAGRCMCGHESGLDVLLALLAFLAVVLMLRILELVVTEPKSDMRGQEEDEKIVGCCTIVSDDDTYERLAYHHVWPSESRRGAAERKRPPRYWRC